MTRPPRKQAPAEHASLNDLQTWMVALLRDRQSLAASEELTRAAAEHFTGNDELLPVEQIDIYRRQFWLRHENILADHFPALTQLLSQEARRSLFESYLSDAQNDVFSLGDLGQDLATHIAARPSFERQDLCVQMAHLEWAYQEAFVAADDATLDGEKMQRATPQQWETARFQLSASLRLLQLKHPVARLRRQLRRGEFTPDQIDQLEPEPQNLVVYRRDRKLWDKQISATAYLLLAQFQKGARLVAACETVVGELPEAEQVLEAELSEWFALWGRLGWIVDVDFSAG